MRPMLAGQFVAEKLVAQLPVYAQPKFDGVRMFVRDGIAWTRSLKPVRSAWVQSLVAHNKDVMEGLDGELICGDPTAEDCYRRTCSSVMSFDKPDETSFHVFDIWNHGGDFDDRISHLQAEDYPDFVQVVETRLLRSLEEILTYEDQLLADGHEGVILRNPRSLYKFGRGSPMKGELIKLKKFLDTEARVVGFHEFMHNSNEQTTNELGYAERSSHGEGLVPMGTLGALEAEGVFPDGRIYRVRIGTGFDTVTRQEVWDNRTDYLGKIVRFKYFGGGIKEAPRFPVFLGFRDADDLSSEQLSLF